MPHHQCLTKPFRNIPDANEYSAGCGEQKDLIGEGVARRCLAGSLAERHSTDRVFPLFGAGTITSRAGPPGDRSRVDGGSIVARAWQGRVPADEDKQVMQLSNLWTKS